MLLDYGVTYLPGCSGFPDALSSLGRPRWPSTLATSTQTAAATTIQSTRLPVVRTMTVTMPTIPAENNASRFQRNAVIVKPSDKPVAV